MSDIDKEIDGGGIFSGSDNKLSLRRIMGLSIAFIGSCLLIASLFIIAKIAFMVFDSSITITMWHMVIIGFTMMPGSIMIIVSLFILKQLTSQAIASIIEKVKK